MPRSGIRYRPAASAPTMAPVVFMPYSSAMRSPSRVVRTTDDLITSGSVAPISAVGTISSAKAMANRASVIIGSESGQRRVEAHVDLLQHVEAQRRRERGGADEQLADAEPYEGPAHAVGDSAGDQAAEGEPGHEARPDGAGRVGGDAEYQSEQAQPQHLIDQRADARREKQDRQRRQQPGLTRSCVERRFLEE